jgi:hypothetical protein
VDTSSSPSDKFCGGFQTEADEEEESHQFIPGSTAQQQQKVLNDVKKGEMIH